jgi:hypothetical protein
MNATSIDNSCEVVKCFIENFFSNYYSSDTMSTPSELVSFLDNSSSCGKNVLYEVTERILYGKSLDRSEFIIEHFSSFLPLGIRIKFIEMLENKLPEILLEISSLSSVSSSFSSTGPPPSLSSPPAAVASLRPSTPQRRHQECLSKNMYLHQLWFGWKSGHLSISELFSKINTLFAEKLVDFKTYQMIIETILIEEGYGIRNQSSSQNEEGTEEKEDSNMENIVRNSRKSSYLPSIPFQQSVYLKGIAFDTVFSLFPSTINDNELEFLTIDQKLGSFSFENDCYSLSSLSGLFPSTSSASVYWRHCCSPSSSSFSDTSNHLSPLPSDCFTTSYSQLISSANNEKEGLARSSKSSIAIVNITDYLRLDRGILEIDSVCAFDIVKSSLSLTNQSFEFAIVLEGRWKGFLSSSSSSSICIDDPSSHMSVDAITEADPHDNNAIDFYENSPNGSGNDNNNSGQQIIPDYSFPHQYYLLVGISLHSHCSIHSIVSLQEMIFPDQLPIGLSYVSSSFGFLYGTNGLLALFEMNRENGYNLPSYWNEKTSISGLNKEEIDETKYLKKEAGTGFGSSSFPSYDFENSITLSLMTSDTFLLDHQVKDSSSLPIAISHRSDAMIISVDYSFSSHRLVSVDNQSMIALWNIHHPSSVSHLYDGKVEKHQKIFFDLVGGSSYYGFHEKHEKVKNVYFTPHGDYLLIACLDKLVLMKINDQLISSSSSSSSRASSFSSSSLPSSSSSITPLVSPTISPCWMFEKCSLDSFPHHYCHYSVVFDEDIIKIWRISTCDSLLSSSSSSSFSSVDTMIEVTSWSHRNIDGFLHRLSSSSSSSSSFQLNSSLSSINEMFFPSSFLSTCCESVSSLPLRKEASSEMDQIQDKDGNLMNGDTIKEEGEEEDDDNDINENMNFLTFNGEFIPIYPGEIMIDTDDSMMMMIDDRGNGNGNETFFRNTEEKQMEEDDKMILEPIESYYVEDLFLSNYPCNPSTFCFSSNADSCSKTGSLSSSSPFLSTWLLYLSYLRSRYHHDNNETFLSLLSLFSVLSVCFQPPSLPLLASTLDMNILDLEKLLRKEFSELLTIHPLSPLPPGSTASTPASLNSCIVVIKPEYKHFFHWLIGKNYYRLHSEFWIDPSLGHNLLCSLYLKHCSNKSVAVEHTWQSYLSIYGASHLRRSSRGLKLLTKQIRKIDETANIRYFLPYQIGYISGLQEIYARRVGLSGKIPKELGELFYLRVLSMGNNRLTGKVPECLGKLQFLQRIVLHQNALGKLLQLLSLGFLIVISFLSFLVYISSNSLLSSFCLLLRRKSTRILRIAWLYCQSCW